MEEPLPLILSLLNSTKWVSPNSTFFLSRPRKSVLLGSQVFGSKFYREPCQIVVKACLRAKTQLICSQTGTETQLASLKRVWKALSAHESFSPSTLSSSKSCRAVFLVVTEANLVWKSLLEANVISHSLPPVHISFELFLENLLCCKQQGCSLIFLHFNTIQVA